MAALTGEATLPVAEATDGDRVPQAEVGSATAASSGTDPAAITFKEVSGSTKSLVDHLSNYEDGDEEFIPMPDLMDFNSWQRWRTQFAKRPTKRLDGYHTNPRQESILWRSTMSACLLYTSPSPRDGLLSRMPSSA